jgi:hypothetical protein
VISLILIGIFLFLLSILWSAHNTTMRTQRELKNCSQAAQLRRAANHMYKIAHTAKAYGLHDALVLVLLQETIRVLKLAEKLAPEHASTHTALLECNEMLSAFDKEMHAFNMGIKVEYPDSELSLMEAQMHLTETLRLLSGMKKRGLILPELHHAITMTLQHAQHALALRLHQRRAPVTPRLEHIASVDSHSDRHVYPQSNFAY